MWMPFMDNGKYYATCSNCRYDDTLYYVSQNKRCPRCDFVHKTIDKSHWIEYRGSLSSSIRKDLVVCPEYFALQEKNTESRRSFCSNCGKKLKVYGGN